ncbi:MAG: hypothetical protein ACOCQR_02270 [bacterium]
MQESKTVEKLNNEQLVQLLEIYEEHIKFRIEWIRERVEKYKDTKNLSSYFFDMPSFREFVNLILQEVEDDKCAGDNFVFKGKYLDNCHARVLIEPYGLEPLVFPVKFIEKEMEDQYLYDRFLYKSKEQKKQEEIEDEELCRCPVCGAPGYFMMNGILSPTEENPYGKQYADEQCDHCGLLRHFDSNQDIITPWGVGPKIKYLDKVDPYDLESKLRDEFISLLKGEVDIESGEVSKLAENIFRLDAALSSRLYKGGDILIEKLSGDYKRNNKVVENNNEYWLIAKFQNEKGDIDIIYQKKNNNKILEEEVLVTFQVENFNLGFEQEIEKAFADFNGIIERKVLI